MRLYLSNGTAWKGWGKGREDETCHEKWVERTTELLPFLLCNMEVACGSGLEDRFLRVTGSSLLLLSYTR